MCHEHSYELFIVMIGEETADNDEYHAGIKQKWNSIQDCKMSANTESGQLEESIKNEVLAFPVNFDGHMLIEKIFISQILNSIVVIWNYDFPVHQSNSVINLCDHSDR